MVHFFLHVFWVFFFALSILNSLSATLVGCLQLLPVTFLFSWSKDCYIFFTFHVKSCIFLSCLSHKTIYISFLSHLCWKTTHLSFSAPSPCHLFYHHVLQYLLPITSKLQLLNTKNKAGTLLFMMTRVPVEPIKRTACQWN